MLAKRWADPIGSSGPCFLTPQLSLGSPCHLSCPALRAIATPHHALRGRLSGAHSVVARSLDGSVNVVGAGGGVGWCGVVWCGVWEEGLLMRWRWGVLRGQRQRVARCLLEVSRNPGGKQVGAAEEAPPQAGLRVCFYTLRAINRTQVTATWKRSVPRLGKKKHVKHSLLKTKGCDFLYFSYRGTKILLQWLLSFHRYEADARLAHPLPTV